MDTRAHEIDSERFAHNTDNHADRTPSSDRVAGSIPRKKPAISADSWRVPYHEAAIQHANDLSADPYRGDLIF